jgi:hypothetical protein
MADVVEVVGRAVTATRSAIAVVAAGLLAGAGCGEGEDMVTAYCRYGAVSQAQLDAALGTSPRQTCGPDPRLPVRVRRP